MAVVCGMYMYKFKCEVNKYEIGTDEDHKQWTTLPNSRLPSTSSPSGWEIPGYFVFRGRMGRLQSTCIGEGSGGSGEPPEMSGRSARVNV